MASDGEGSIKSEGEFRGSGVIRRTLGTTDVLSLDGVLNHLTCAITNGRAEMPTPGAEVVQYDGPDSTPESRHYTPLGRVAEWDVAAREGRIEASFGVCQQVDEGRYRKLWSTDGRVVLVLPEDIVDGVLAAKLVVPAEPAPQRPVAAPRFSRTLVTGRVPLDLSRSHLGRAGQRYTVGFLRRVAEQLEGKDFPLADQFDEEGNPVRSFGHTVFHTVQADPVGRLTVDVEAPAEVVEALRSGASCLGFHGYLNTVDKRGATESGPPEAVCVPLLTGLRLFEGPAGSALDLREAVVILDAPG